MKEKKIGIMGGTFDPIHTAHLILGEQAYEEFGLDCVWFMPSGNPPHKTDRRGRAGNPERLHMVRLAVRDNPHFRCSDFEMRREGFIYTWQTLSLLLEQNHDHHYYFIIGADSLFDFEKWRCPERIARLCTLIAGTRDHADEEKMQKKIAELREKYQADIRLMHSPNIDISSHMIRDAVAEGHSIRYYVPDAVRQYIESRKLYGDPYG